MSVRLSILFIILLGFRFGHPGPTRSDRPWATVEDKSPTTWDILSITLVGIGASLAAEAAASSLFKRSWWKIRQPLSSWLGFDLGDEEGDYRKEIKECLEEQKEALAAIRNFLLDLNI